MHEFSGFCIHLEFQTIIPKSVFNGILIGKVFQFEVSDGLVHSLGTRQKVNLHTARVFTGARVFRSLYAFKVPNHHSKQCVQSHLHRRSISKQGFRAPWKLAKSKLASCLGVYGGMKFYEFVFV